MSCKRELSQDERDKLRQDSINQKILAMGMNADSSFSYRKYEKDLEKKFEDDSVKPELIFIPFSDYQFIFYNDSVTYFYYNKFPYDKICGTEALQDSNDKKITELFKVTKKDLVKLNDKSILDLVKNLENDIVKSDKRVTIVLGVNKDSIKNKELQKLREYLVNTDFGYQYRPLSTRERLVADAKFKNTSEDFSKINWDSAYHVDFKKFYPEN
ncbi:hypothetical protein HXZ94_05855 [Empedobacter falsenii]|uniref:hypothetical protein n=1 Tax=Empedobacter falsenii TaxID=343874 RepID=UPI002575B27B|nr:hypothetical protein [Empedobacter falsenii]MDM1298021.1 hypothetical protein [Empedobacter falsenii]MDM1317904.1 hypothetical protein [Empedobacter falsenii]